MLKEVGICISQNKPHENCGSSTWRPQFHLSFPDTPTVESQVILKIVGGAPHGWGVWVNGVWHRVDVSNVIDEITGLLEASR